MKTRITKLLVLLLSVVMVTVIAAGCSDNPKNGAEKPDQNTVIDSGGVTAEPVTLKLFFSGAVSGAAIPSGLQDDGVVKEIEKKLGVKLDFIGNTTDDQLASYLASGEILDLTMVSNTKLFSQIIQGKLALNLNDLVESHGKDLLANAPEKIEYSKKAFSDGTESLYVIPGSSGPGMISDTYTFGLNIRWDLYKELGYPEINSYLDILPVLKSMQDLEPTNENGQKTYAISLNTDWDGSTALYTLLLAPMYGWDTTEHDFHAEIDNANGYAVKNSFDPDSWMFKGADFLYQANKMGLLDPDSISQKFSSRDEKMKAGRILSSFVHWDVGGFNAAMEAAGKPEIGMMPVYPKDSKTMWNFGPEPNGIGGGWVISSKTEHPEKAMEFLNFINSYEGAMLIFNGVRDKDWVEKDGKPYFTDEAIEASKDVNSPAGIGKYYNASGLNEWTTHPQYEEMLGGRQWATTKERTYSQLYKDYDEYYGVDTPYKAYDKQRGKEVFSDAYRPYMDVMPDDISAINTRISDMVKNDIYKMIFAKNDAERDQVKTNIIKKAQDLGIDKEIEWVLQNRKEAKAKYEEAIGK